MLQARAKTSLAHIIVTPPRKKCKVTWVHVCRSLVYKLSGHVLLVPHRLKHVCLAGAVGQGRERTPGAIRVPSGWALFDVPVRGHYLQACDTQRALLLPDYARATEEICAWLLW